MSPIPTAGDAPRKQAGSIHPAAADSDVAAVSAAEDSFQRAMRDNDADALDALLHDEVHFTGPDGATLDKAADLEAHRSGRLVVDALDEVGRAVQVVEAVGLVRVTLDLALRVEDSPVRARVAYTRVWALDERGWRVIAAHGSVVPPSVAPDP